MKIRTADLSGAQLDYHTARAQGVPAERLEIRRVPRTDTLICVGREAHTNHLRVQSYSTDWCLAGALLEQHKVFLNHSADWFASPTGSEVSARGLTPQVAICRAVVRAAFGEEVEEVAVCE